VCELILNNYIDYDRWANGALRLITTPAKNIRQRLKLPELRLQRGDFRGR